VWSKELASLKLASVLASSLPGPVLYALARATGRGLARLPDFDGRRALVASHMGRVTGLGQERARALVPEVMANYGQYWAESLRLPHLAPSAVVAGVTTEGEEHVDAALEAGRGVIIAAPHLGGWEWGARYLVARGVPVTVAVEELSPPDVFDWFTAFRTRLGMGVVPVGPGASSAVTGALRAGHAVCLLSDRLVGATAGVEVDFFGARTKLPAGPVTLSVRTGAPVVAAAIYFGRGQGAHHIVFRRPLELGTGSLREVVRAGTQSLASQLEELVRREPTQWHIAQPNWPDDPRLRGRRA
jgi:KDO2-lipid IV(A) lauroyltransferase